MVRSLISILDFDTITSVTFHLLFTHPKMINLFLILIVSPLLATTSPISFNAKENIIGIGGQVAAQWRGPSQQRSQRGEVVYG
jgi:hypothetical protein